MAYADKNQQREYCRQWVAARRAAWFATRNCINCGNSTELELDHVDQTTKVSHNVWSWAEEKRNAELAKCQALCRQCHKEKTRQQLRRPLICGTDRAYNAGCRCSTCKEFKQAKNKRFRSHK